MLKNIEDISATKKRLTIEIPADAIEQEIRDSLEKVRQQTRIPGFRPGKAPIELIEKRYGKEVEADVLEKIIPRGYMTALQEADITPVASPVLDEKIDFKRHQPISLTLTLEVMPKVEQLQYEKIPVKEMPVSVADEEVSSVIERHREEKATYDPSEGPVASGDLLILDYTLPDGKVMKDQIYKAGGSMFPDDFSQNLIGKMKGDTFSAETTFPEEHPSEDLAGKKLVLSVTVKDLKKVSLPAVDDELAKDAGFGSLSEMREHISGEILKAKQGEIAKIQKGEILKNLIDSHDFEIPETLLENEAALLFAAAATKKEQGAEPTKEEFEARKQELKPEAVRNVKASLLIQMIGKREGVAVSDDELKGAILSISRRFGVAPEQIMKFYISRDGSLDGLKRTVFEDKVLDLVLSKAAKEKGAS